MDNTSALKKSLESSIKRGYFIHSNGNVNTVWIDLFVFNEKLLEIKNTFTDALRILFQKIQETQKGEIETVVLTTKTSASSDQRLTILNDLIPDIAYELKMSDAYIKTVGPDILKIEGQLKDNVILLIGLTTHEYFLRQCIKTIVEIYGKKLRGIITIIDWEESLKKLEYLYLYLFKFSTIKKDNEEDYYIELNKLLHDDNA